MLKNFFYVFLVVAFLPRISTLMDFDPFIVSEFQKNIDFHSFSFAEKNLQQFEIFNILLEINFEKPSKWVSKECQEELAFLGYGLINSASSRKNHSILPIPKPKTMTEQEQIDYLIPMMDAAGKIGSGLTRGHFISAGQFSECRNINIFSTTLNRTIRGDFYRFLIDYKMRPFGQNNSCQVPQIGIDVCLPMVCENQDLTQYFRSAIGKNGSLSPICRVRHVNDRLLPPNIFTFILMFSAFFFLSVEIFVCKIEGFFSAFLSSIAILSIVVGAFDYFHQQTANVAYNQIDQTNRSTSLFHEFVHAFSLYKNVKEVFDTTSKTEGQVTSLNCIRTISTVWVITGHCAAILTVVCTNPFDLIDYSKTFLGMILANAYLSVDTFFFISGFLLSFLWFKQLKVNRRRMLSISGWIMFYFHRFARLSPVYYITILFYTFIFTRLIKDMPIAMTPGIKDDTCPQFFWRNLLYIQNLFDTDQVCYVVSWFLATDFQIYLFSPILLIIFAVAGKVAGLVVSLIIILLSIALNSYEVINWHFPPTNFDFGPKHPDYDPSKHSFEQWNYYNPLIRCPIFIIGIVLGYFMRQNPKVRINAWLDRFMWTISLGSMIFFVFIYETYTNGELWSSFVTILYSSMSRIVWGLALSWITISTYYRKSLINDFMSLPLWAPLARLSFCTYLLHIMVLAFFFGKNFSQLYFYSFYSFVIEIVTPVTIFSFILSILWTSMFEIPFSKITTILINGSGQRKPRKTENPTSTPKPLSNISIYNPASESSKNSINFTENSNLVNIHL